MRTNSTAVISGQDHEVSVLWFYNLKTEELEILEINDDFGCNIAPTELDDFGAFYDQLFNAVSLGQFD